RGAGHSPAAVVLPGAWLLHRPGPTRGPLRRRARALLLQRRELRAPRPRRGARSRAGRARHRDRAGLRAAPEVPHLPAVRAAQHRRDAVLDPRPRRGPQPGGDGLVGPARLGTMSAMSRRATIIDVAQRAGVSRQTVSRAMSDLPGSSAAPAEAPHAPPPHRAAADPARRVGALAGYGAPPADTRGGGGMPVGQPDGRGGQRAEGGVAGPARTRARAELAAHPATSGARP